MSQANPFQQSMVRMQAPADSGTSVSVSGFTIDIDEDGCVTVPKDVAASLSSHGFTPPQPKATPAKK